MACGTGELVCKLKPELKTIHGYDLSADMINIARKKTKSDSIFQVGNITDYFPLRKYELASCNFDSINYLLNKKQWLNFFKNTFNVLESGGMFVFDYVTCYDIEYCWPESVNVNKSKDFVLLRLGEYIDRKKVGKEIHYWHIKVKNKWEVFKEIHYHKSFPNQEVLKLLEIAGFKVMETLDENGGSVSETTIRVIVIAKKK